MNRERAWWIAIFAVGAAVFSFILSDSADWAGPLHPEMSAFLKVLAAALIFVAFLAYVWGKGTGE